MSENLPDQRRIFNSGDNPKFSTAIQAGLDVDREHSLEALHPTHRSPRFIGVDGALRAARHDTLAMLEVRCEHAVKSSQIQPWSGDQRSQAGNEVQRLQYHVGRSVTERLFVAVYDSAPIIH